MWWYEIRDSDNRLLDLRREYFNEDAAQDAGEYAKRVLEEITPGRTLTLKTGADE